MLMGARVRPKSDRLRLLNWLGVDAEARSALCLGDPRARAFRASLAWGVGASLLVLVDVLSGIFPIGPLGVLVILLLALPIGGVPGFVVERLAFKLAKTHARRVLLTLAVSTVVFVYLLDGMNVFATLLGKTTVASMLRQVLVCVVATGPWLLGCWLYLRAMVAPRSQHFALAAGLAILGLLPAIAGRVISIEEYGVVHTVLRWAALAGLGSALFVVVPDERRVPAGYLYALPPALVLAFALFPFARQEFAPGMQARPFGRLMLESARTLVDFDRDGYAAWLGYGDCAPFDAKINPGRPEVPGNGVDDNCRLGDAPLPTTRPAPGSPPRLPAGELPSIVLITTDALRADHLSGYGYGRPTTPFLDKWAQAGAWFSSAFTPGTRTGATLPALHYGVGAERLRWTPLYETTRLDLVAARDLKPNELLRRAIGFALEQPRPSLAKLLHERGLRTAAIVDDGQSPFLDLRPGFLSDYDSYWQMKADQGLPYGDEATSAKAREVLAGISAGPFFMWVHFFGTHTPTTITPGLPRFSNDKVGGYDHEIRAWDTALSKLLLDLEQLGKTRQLAIIVTSDHGEVFTPLGRAHGVSAEEANFHVPLMVQAPGMPGGRSDALVSSLDLVPMILNLTGGSQGLELDGRDLRELAAHPESTRDRVLFSAATAFHKDLSPELYFDIALGFGKKVVFDEIRNQVTVSKLGDFSDGLVPPDADSDRLLKALFQHLEETPGLHLRAP